MIPIPTVLPWLHPHYRGITATNVPITAGITVVTAVLPQSPSPCQSLTDSIYGSIFVQIFLVSSVKRFFSARVLFGRSRSSKVIDFGTNRKRVCDFLLVRHSNLGSNLHCFKDIAGFCVHDPTLFHSNFAGVSFGTDRRCWGQSEHLGLP